MTHGLLACSLARQLAGPLLARWLACSLVFRHPYAVVVEHVLPYRDYSTYIIYLYIRRIVYE